MREPRATGLQHGQRQLVPRAIPSVVVGHASFVQAGLVHGPFFGQIQAHVDQGMARARHVAHVDGDLTGVDLAQAATPLARHPHRLSTRLGKPSGIEHQHAVGLSQVLCDLARQLLAQGHILPRSPANAALQGQAVLSKAIRNRFDIFAFHIREQSTDRGMGMLVGLLATEGLDKGRHKGCQPRHHLVENLRGNLTLISRCAITTHTLTNR